MQEGWGNQKYKRETIFKSSSLLGIKKLHVYFSVLIQKLHVLFQVGSFSSVEPTYRVSGCHLVPPVFEILNYPF